MNFNYFFIEGKYKSEIFLVANTTCSRYVLSYFYNSQMFKKDARGIH